MRRSSHARPPRVERLVRAAAALWRRGGRAVEPRPARPAGVVAVPRAVIAELLALLLLERLALGDHDGLLAGGDHADVVAGRDVRQGGLRMVADDRRAVGDRDRGVLVVQAADRLVDRDVAGADRLDGAAVRRDG